VPPEPPQALLEQALPEPLEQASEEPLALVPVLELVLELVLVLVLELAPPLEVALALLPVWDSEEASPPASESEASMSPLVLAVLQVQVQALEARPRCLV